MNRTSLQWAVTTPLANKKETAWNQQPTACYQKPYNFPWHFTITASETAHIKITCIALQSVYEETRSYLHRQRFTHDLLTSAAKCVKLCFKINVWICLCAQHASKSPLALAWRIWPKVQLRTAFLLLLAASKHIYFYVGNTQWDPKALTLNLTSHFRHRFLKYCLPLHIKRAVDTPAHNKITYAVHP